MSAQSGADELQRRYLNDIFAELCRIESPSGSERACAVRVTQELAALGVEVHEDDAAGAACADSGNLLARIPGAPGGSAPERPALLLCAHLDTVPLLAPVEPVIRDGHWENANEGILGADNKAAVAVLLALARHAHRHTLPVDLELLFTVGEERALAGAGAFDVTRLRSRLGYVFDHSAPLGGMVLSSPTHYELRATFNGVAAHSGVRPEDGRSAILAAARAVADMPLGRIDEQSTANVGTIAGGSAINVVPAHCEILAEVRSHSPERAEELVGELVDCVHEAANLPDCECDVDIALRRTFAGYRISPGTPAVRAAEHALRAIGHEPRRVSSGGASDANALIAHGLTTVNLANGTERNHEPGERIAVAALEASLDLALALPAAVAAVLAQAQGATHAEASRAGEPTGPGRPAGAREEAHTGARPGVGGPPTAAVSLDLGL
ncbi:MAG TPA: M20/M25/M40 family metallo-hydrolase [Solirubrobacteraceae bacterium]|nr:M20/M25/M40 family metallo-hydrolase [Solirubrobacteraceae bacterium]